MAQKKNELQSAIIAWKTVDKKTAAFASRIKHSHIIKLATPLVNESNRIDFQRKSSVPIGWQEKWEEKKPNWLINHRMNNSTKSAQHYLCNTFTFHTLTQIIFFLISNEQFLKAKWKRHHHFDCTLQFVSRFSGKKNDKDRKKTRKISTKICNCLWLQT